MAARERRQDQLESFAGAFPCLVMLSFNLPGAEKTGERAERLFSWALKEVAGALDVRLLHSASDPLGPYALYGTGLSPESTKELTILLETYSRGGRLMDLDVYQQGGAAVGREQLGLPPRPCLVCDEPAVECMRLKRHDMHILQEEVHAIIDAL